MNQEKISHITQSLRSVPHKSRIFFKHHRGKMLFLTLGGSYMFSPEIGYFKNEGKWIVADDSTKKHYTLDSLYQTQDRETNTIHRLFAGVVKKKDIDSLISLYGHKEAFDTMMHYIPLDTLLYKCLSDMSIQLYNPHVSFSGDYTRDVLGNMLGYDASFTNAKVAEMSSRIQLFDILHKGVFGDTTYFTHNLDSIAQAECKPVLPIDIEQKLNDINKKGMIYLLNNLFGERGHIRQLHREGLIRNYTNYAGDYIKNGCTQHALYDIPNTVENITHETDNGFAKGDEGILIAIFLKMYEQRMDKNNPFYIKRLIGFYSGDFRAYKDMQKADLYRAKLKTMKK